jgi:hypothetical protein
LSKRSHIGGRRIGGKHTTAIEPAAIIIAAARQDPSVTKTTLGPIIGNAYCRLIRLVMLRIPGGLRIKVNAHGPLQTLYVQTSDQAATEQRLSIAFLNTYPEATVQSMTINHRR